MSLPASTRTPGFTLSEVFGGPGTSPGAASLRTLLIASALFAPAIDAVVNTSAGTSVTFTTQPGTTAPDTAVSVFSAADAAAKFGRGSVAHNAAAAYFAHDRTGVLWIGAPSPAAGPAASATLTPTGAPTASCVLRIIVAGRTLEVPLSSTDTVSTIGAALARAINQAADLPVTATNVWATGAVTLTAKCTGLSGNRITLAVEIVTATASRRSTAAALAPSLAGLTLTLSNGAAAGGASPVYRLAGAVADEDWTTLLASLAGQRFDRIGAPAYVAVGGPSGNLARLADHADTMADVPTMAAQQVIFGSVESLGTTVTLAAMNRLRCMMAWLRNADASPAEIAAQVAAARLVGDAGVAGVVNGIDGEAVTPAANLNGVELATLAAPTAQVDLITGPEVEAVLGSGVSPLVPSTDRPGRTVLVASVTTRSQSGGVPDYSVYKTKEVTVLDRVRDEIVATLRRTYRGYNLAPDRSDGRPPDTPRTVTPSTVRAFVLSLLRGYQRQGWIIQVDERAAELTARIHPANPRRLDMTIPCTPAQDFDLGTGDLQQRSPLVA